MVIRHCRFLRFSAAWVDESKSPTSLVVCGSVITTSTALLCVALFSWLPKAPVTSFQLLKPLKRKLNLWHCPLKVSVSLSWKRWHNYDRRPDPGSSHNVAMATSRTTETETLFFTTLDFPNSRFRKSYCGGWFGLLCAPRLGSYRSLVAMIANATGAKSSTCVQEIQHAPVTSCYDNRSWTSSSR